MVIMFSYIVALNKALFFFNQNVSVFFLFLDKNICCGTH